MFNKWKKFLNTDFSADGFTLKPRDAYETANNINIIFTSRTGWFRTPKPIHIDELRKEYKLLCPAMEIEFPGIVDKIFHPDIIRKFGYPVDDQGMVHWKP